MGNLRDTAMAEKSDDFVVYFDLSDFVMENEQTMNNNELQEVPDDVLRLNQQDLEPETIITVQSATIDVDANEQQKNSRLKKCSEQDLNEIAHKICAKNTHSQTRWAVKTFKG